MGHFKDVVMDYLQADGAVFINTKFRIQLDELGESEKPGQWYSCDAVAIDLRHGAIYLCETAFEHKFRSLVKKLSTWTKNWESIKSALRMGCRIPADWRIYSELIKARHAYVEHMARCLTCSQPLVIPDALATIRERLKTSRIQ
jgi:hypothetical protein